MRQAGILAAAGILSLQKGPKRMVQDHKFTKMLAETAKEAGQGLVRVDLDEVETNMVMLKVNPDSGMTTAALVDRLARSTEEEKVVLGSDIRLLCYVLINNNFSIFNLLKLFFLPGHDVRQCPHRRSLQPDRRGH